MVPVCITEVDHASRPTRLKHFSSLPVSPEQTVLVRALYPRTDVVGAEVRSRDDTMPTVNFALAVEGVGWSSPDYFPMLVLHSVFGNCAARLACPQSTPRA